MSVFDDVFRNTSTLERIERKVNAMSESLDHLKASETALIGKVDEAIALLHTLKAHIDDLLASSVAATPADLKALSDALDAAAGRLSGEIAADTTPAA